MAYNVCYPEECCMCTWKEYALCYFWMECSISVMSIWSNVSLFKASVSLLIFSLGELSIDISGVLKSPSIVVYLSVSLFMSFTICLMYLFLLCWMHMYFNCYIFLGWPLDHYIVSFFVSYKSLYFKVLFCSDIATLLSFDFYLHRILFSFPSL